MVEPDYKSKFPPLGLLRIAAYHKDKGDHVTFVRGMIPQLREVFWHRVYVSSLFTYELPRTVRTLKFYSVAVNSPRDLYVGGVGATLMPDYIRRLIDCTIISGPLDKPDMLEPGSPPLAIYPPDFSVLSSVTWQYEPADAYFCRLTLGCIRRCAFCAVPLLEPKFVYLGGLPEQISTVRKLSGERRDLVLLDNNVLACNRIEEIINTIRDQGFEKGAKLNGRQRAVDFNQGLDARLITEQVGKLLGTICLSPVRLALDHDSIRPHYERAIRILADCGFREFTTYVMYNFDDTPLSFYNRIRLNVELSAQLGIRISGFPMKYVPVHDIARSYVSKNWCWRYLRGIQCILLATHGLVSPNPEFFSAAFGQTYEEFLEIISMPDRYIIYRDHYKNNGAYDWKVLYRKLSPSDRQELMSVLYLLHTSPKRERELQRYAKFKDILEHYYPGGKTPPRSLPAT